MMKRYKVRVTGYGIEANAIIPFEVEPTIEQIGYGECHKII